MRAYIPRTRRGEEALRGRNIRDYGWIPHIDRTPEEERINDEILAAMPQFKIIGKTNYGDDKKICLTDLWSHPDTVAALGYAFPGVHQFSGSCFPPGTPVRMADGTEKNIEDIKIGDSVLSHTGTKRKVVRLINQNYTGTMHTFHVKGWAYPVTTTHDHDCLIVDSKKPDSWCYKPGKYVKKKAEDVQVDERMLLPFAKPAENDGPSSIDLALFLDDCEATGIDEVTVTSPKGEVFKCRRHIPVDYRLGYILGLYLAEGSLKHNAVFFTMNPDGKRVAATTCSAFIKELFGDIEIEESNPKPTVLKLRVRHGVLARFIRKLIPDTVYTKRVPALLMRANETARLGLLRGWLDGDGHFSPRKSKKHGHGVRGVTASDGLARDMGRISLSLGMKPSVCRRKQEKHQRVASKDVYLNNCDVVRLYPEKECTVKLYKARSMQTKDGWCVPVTKIEKQEVENYQVYCVEVEVEHSLIVNDIAYHQCVGAGAGNVEFTTIAHEAIRLGEAEKIVVPFWLFPYGRSRYRSGMRGRGDGSTGGGMAEALVKDGLFEATLDDLPKFENSDQLCWYENAEYDWSDGSRFDKKWLELAIKHLFKTASPCKDSGDVREAICNGYAVTNASMWGCTNPRVKGSKYPILVGTRNTEWSHQTSFLAWWEHPELGEHIWYMNQWGKGAHGKCPSGMPEGGMWLPMKEVDSICREGEVFAFSQFEGFPSNDIPKTLFKIIGK